MDDDEPYSPGGSDEDDLGLTTLPSTFLAGASTNTQNDSQIQREVEELNRQIEAEKKQIAMHLQSADTSDLTTTNHSAPVWDTFGHFGDTKHIDEPYSPSNSVSPPINTNLSDVVSKISIPANLADILQNVSVYNCSKNYITLTIKYNIRIKFFNRSHHLEQLHQLKCLLINIQPLLWIPAMNMYRLQPPAQHL